jgi:hypothetical protein
MEIAAQHVTMLPPSLVKQVPEVPQGVEEVLFKAMAKDPKDRFASMQAFAIALQQASMLPKINEPSLQESFTTLPQPEIDETPLPASSTIMSPRFEIDEAPLPESSTIDPTTASTYVSSPPVAKRGITRRLLLTGLAALALTSSGVAGWHVTQNLLMPTPKPPTNLALNKRVYSNSSLENSRWGANLLTDGKETSVSGINEGYTSNGIAISDARNDPPYVVIDLGSNQTFNTVKLFPRTDGIAVGGGTADFPVNFTIQVANNTLAYTTVANVVNQANPKGVAQTYTFPAITGRYVMVKATTLGTPPTNEPDTYRMQIVEIEVFFTNPAHIKSF